MLATGIDAIVRWEIRAYFEIFDAKLPEVLEQRVRQAQKAEKTVCELTDEIL